MFYAKDITPGAGHYTMDEPTSKYCIQVLRHEMGDEVFLTDGRGGRYTTAISDDNRKKCVVQVKHYELTPPVQSPVRIAISFTKNTSRIEWFLEKATEIGIQMIIPLVSQRTEKEKFRADRFENILVSAMLQSQQYYLPELTAPMSFEALVQQPPAKQLFIAHCLPEQKAHLWQSMQPGQDSLLLIGPEGDFTPEEIRLALGRGFRPVSLGDTRLRTETAGIVGCTMMNAVNAGK
jgi:16S rRNA (uracil1498-N3)-methyltransferase